jgi:two-component system cell cycle sensor histidine kinase/response regulator CckA
VSLTGSNNLRIRILVVDDEPDILMTLNAILEGRGHYVKTFENPAEALNHLTSSTNNGDTSCYDLVITDYRMPGSGISGSDLAKQVKEHTRRKTRVFLMSGSFNESSLPEEFIRVLKSGIVDEFIQKPFSKDKLIAIIEKRFSHNENH